MQVYQQMIADLTAAVETLSDPDLAQRVDSIRRLAAREFEILRAAPPARFVVRGYVRDSEEYAGEYGVEAEPWLLTLSDQELLNLLENDGDNGDCELYDWYIRGTAVDSNAPAHGVKTAMRIEAACSDSDSYPRSSVSTEDLLHWVEQNRPQVHAAYTVSAQLGPQAAPQAAPQQQDSPWVATENP